MRSLGDRGAHGGAVRKHAEVDPVDQGSEAVVIERERRDELAPPGEGDQPDPVLGPAAQELLRHRLRDEEPVLGSEIFATHAPRDVDRDHDVDSLAHDLPGLVSRLRARGRDQEEKCGERKKPPGHARQMDTRPAWPGERPERWNRKLGCLPSRAPNQVERHEGPRQQHQ